MIHIVNAENRHLFERDLLEMHRHRRAVFVDRLGWRLRVVGDLEIDQYDREDTIYLLVKRPPDEQLLASVRLLPTDRPHLMSEVFPHLCESGVPSGSSIWEASRFCTNPVLRDRRERLEQLWQIICAVMETALLFGVGKVTFVANRTLLPLAMDCGWDAAALGPTVPDGKDEMTAAVARITPEGLRRVRSHSGITGPVTRFHPPAARVAA